MLWYISFLSADSLQRESGRARTMGEAVEQKASGRGGGVKKKKKSCKLHSRCLIMQMLCLHLQCY